MTENAGWQWIGRLADVSAVVIGIIFPIATTTFVVIKYRRLTHAVGWDLAWAAAVATIALVGTLIFIDGVRRRRDPFSTFRPQRGRDGTSRLVWGSAMLLIAIVGILTF